ncbi:MAG: N-formylglutamate amidohydrolase [Rhodobacterales bacterium]|nr:MAG: N-formylglutamate amidohydrolase [Rhodobacterales bacterium]
MSALTHKIAHPARRLSPVVFASPHSGRAYPQSFLRRARLCDAEIRSSEDIYVDLLVDRVPDFGAPLIRAGVPRAYVDMNRAAEELDPALVHGVRSRGFNARISSGLGVIPRVVAGGRPIYDGKIPMAEAQRRIALFWRPYHAALSGLLRESAALFGEAILLDIHSMPPEALDSVTRMPRPEIVLGDRYGASAASTVTDRVEAAFADAGFKVARNTPFAGAYITQTYGRPARGVHCVQIEIDRTLYLEKPGALEQGPKFHAFRERLLPVMAELAQIGAGAARSLAAE